MRSLLLVPRQHLGLRLTRRTLLIRRKRGKASLLSRELTATYYVRLLDLLRMSTSSRVWCGSIPWTRTISFLVPRSGREVAPPTKLQRKPKKRNQPDLHNEHGYASGEHCHRCDRYNGPSQAWTWLALHQLLVGSNEQDCNEKEGSQQSVDDCCPIECFHRIDAGEV